MLSLTCDSLKMWSLKKGQTELCRTDIDSQTLKIIVSKGDSCYDHCTNINVINSLSNKKRKKRTTQRKKKKKKENLAHAEQGQLRNE